MGYSRAWGKLIREKIDRKSRGTVSLKHILSTKRQNAQVMYCTVVCFYLYVRNRSVERYEKKSICLLKLKLYTQSPTKLFYLITCLTQRRKTKKE